MRRLLPVPVSAPGGDTTGDEDGPYAGLVLGQGDDPIPIARPWVALGMVVGLDGSTTVDGRSGDLGGRADALAFRRLRDATDTVLVGAATVRAEGYGPGTVDAVRRADRQERGLAPHPRIVVISARADLDPGVPLLAERPDDVAPPLLVVPARLDAAGEARLAALEATGRLEVARLDAGTVDGPPVAMEALLSLLHGHGCRTVLCEGGPTLAAALVAADLVDETFLTVAPLLVGGDGPRLLAPPLGATTAAGPRRFGLVEVWEDDDELLLRHRRRR